MTVKKNSRYKEYFHYVYAKFHNCRDNEWLLRKNESKFDIINVGN
jgi:hypothetical protein